jgi:hypothetical protein
MVLNIIAVKIVCLKANVAMALKHSGLNKKFKKFLSKIKF